MFVVVGIRVGNPEDGNLQPNFGVRDTPIILYNFPAHPRRGCAEMHALLLRDTSTVFSFPGGSILTGR